MMNAIDLLFKDIAAILRNMQSTDFNLAKRLDIIEKKLNTGSHLIPIKKPTTNVGSETGIEDTKEYS